MTVGRWLSSAATLPVAVARAGVAATGTVAMAAASAAVGTAAGVAHGGALLTDPVRAAATRRAAAAGDRAGTAGHVVADAAGTAGSAVADAASAAARTAAGAAHAARDATAGAASHVTFGRQHRRWWVRGGHAHIEVHGVDRPGREAMADRLEAALRRVKGVRWAQVNAILGRVVVAFDPEEGPTLQDLLGVIEGVEQASKVAREPFPPDRPEHPADVEPLRRMTIALAADVVALGASTVGQLLQLTPVPTEVATVLSLIDNDPRARQFLQQRFGATFVDLGLGLGTAFAQALTQGPAGLLADIAHRTNTVTELQALRRCWERLEPTLHASPRDNDVDAIARDPRPGPLRDGPVERYADGAALASVGALGVGLLVTGSPRRAGALMAAGLPKAARHGREGFAAELGRELARRDLVVLDRQVLRRLDRVDAVVVHAALVDSGRYEAGSPVPVAPTDVSAVSRQLARLVDLGRLDRLRRRGGWACGPLPVLEAAGVTVPDAATAAARELAGAAVAVLGVARHGTVVAVVPVEPVLDPWAHPIAEAAEDAGIELVLAGGSEAVAAALGSSSPMSGDGELRAVVRSLQADGKGVLMVAGNTSDAAHAALDAADCAIGIRHRGGCPPWGADIVAGPGLQDVPFLLSAVGAARRVSGRSIRYAVGGSAVAALGVVAGPAIGATWRASLPTNVAALASQAHGVLTAAALAHRPAPRPLARTAWHAMEPADVLAALRSASSGLQAHEAARRTVRRPAPPSTPRKVLAAVGSELANPLTPLLAIGAGLSAAVGSVSDAGLVAGVTVINTAIGAVERVRAETSIERLFAAETSVARVRRPGRAPEEVATDALVPGDVVELAAGDVVPADCRVLEATACEADESALTGESLPVRKTPAATPGAPLADREGMLYEGTSISSGSAVAVVVAAGEDTEVGRSLAEAPEPPPSGVEARLSSLTAVTAPVTIASGAAVTALGVLRGRAPRQAVSSGVGLMVAAVPEGLPLLATMAQQAAAHRLAGHGALARNPRTIEALGRVDTLCFDKTGTLTVGEIALQRVCDGLHDDPVDVLTPPTRAVLAAALRASPDPDGDDVATLPHATDRAIVAGGEHAGVEAAEGLGGWEPLGELAFDPARGYHAAVGDSPDGARICVKGAPEIVLRRCRSWRGEDGVVPIDRRVRAHLDRTVERLARRGLRILAVAERTSSDHPEVTEERVADLELLGFVALADSVRPSAAQAVSALRDAGVDVVMVTGDHPSTAAAIARELGILNGHRVVSGAELDRMADDELAEVIPDVSVFARVTPRDKVRIVRAYQRAGRVVAMTGDGANDAPAIRLAHTGIALGERGSPAAREAADLVVVDDRMETILDAVVEGRSMWVSVRDALAILVGGNLGEVGFTLVTTSITGVSPLSARQFLLVNLLTDMLPATAIALRPPHRSTPATLLAEGPDKSLGSALVGQIALRAAATTAGATGAWALARATGRRRRASTVALAALVGTQLGQTAVLANGSPLVLASTAASAAALAAIVQTPGVSHFFGCTPLGPVGWSIAAGTAATATAGAVLVPRLAPRAAEELARRVTRQPVPAVDAHPLPALPAGSGETGPAGVTGPDGPAALGPVRPA